MIILDTCALLWLAAGDDRLSDEARARIDAETLVGVSAISAFEVGLKHAQGKLDLPLPPREWWARVIEHHRLDVLTVTPEVLFTAVSLPPLHRDAADRFIIATATIQRAPVVTTDGRFAQYGVAVLS